MFFTFWKIQLKIQNKLLWNIYKEYLRILKISELINKICETARLQKFSP